MTFPKPAESTDCGGGDSDTDWLSYIQSDMSCVLSVLNY